MTNLVAHPVDLYPGQPPGVVREHEVPEHAVPRGRIEQLERALLFVLVFLVDIGGFFGRGVVPAVDVAVAVGESEPASVAAERDVEALPVRCFIVTFYISFPMTDVVEFSHQACHKILIVVITDHLLA